jgi:oxygen-independent coproporphyrinogen III oxidase
LKKAAKPMTAGISARYSETAPRYTSYPTAPHFHTGVGPETVAGWMQTIGEDEELSLYLHIPFCDRLCWFCACHTKHTLRYEPVQEYLRSLYAEIATVSRLLGGRGRIRTVHFGGGSPTMLRPEDLIRLDRTLRDAFRYDENTEVSVEIDPNDMDEGRLDALAAIGLTRASLGIQDFDPKVQKAINREQSFEQTKAVVEGLSSRGVGSINLDMLYGLPFQTRDSIRRTAEFVLTLRPDRIALFGYAHVPWFKKHQQMIDEAALPDANERFAQSRLVSELIQEGGFEAIGIDHFARPGDRLAIAAREGRLHRNFQGYTDDRCETMIGLGPSSVGKFRQGYAQNAVAAGQYERMVDAGGLATVRGIELSDDDRARAWIIERLMCDFAFSCSEAVERFGKAAEAAIVEAGHRAASGPDRLLERKGDSFVVSEAGRPLVRLVAAQFDQYLTSGNARHSVAV